MIVSISGIDGAGKTSLVKLLAQELGFYVPNHVSAYEKFPEDLTVWYTKGNIDKVVALDLKAFKRRNDAAQEKKNAVLDRGYQNVIDSACARYQERLHISYDEAFKRVKKVNETIGFYKVEKRAVLLDFPFSDWNKVQDMLIRRVGDLSEQYIGYLKILHDNLKASAHTFDVVIDATKPPSENLAILKNSIV